jgi:sulfur carrier protein
VRLAAPLGGRRRVGSVRQAAPYGTVPEILLNGEAREVAAGATVLDLLAELGRHPRTVAVERNGDILPRERYGATALAQGDRLEIVGFVQGGGRGLKRPSPASAGAGGRPGRKGGG